MPLFVNSSGWKTVKNIFVKQSGNWRNIKNGWINQNGIWRQFYASVPGAPTINSIATTYPDNVVANYLTVSFSPPTINNTNITSYQYSLNSGSWVTVGTATSFNITGLTPGTSYSVVLRAVNSNGAGDSSNTASTVAAGRPLLPVITNTSTRVPYTSRPCVSRFGGYISATATANNNGSTPVTMQYRTGTTGNWINGSSWSGGTVCAGMCAGQACNTVSFRALNPIGTGPTITSSICVFWGNPC